MAARAYLDRLARTLANDGKLIEAGWIALRMQAIPLNAPAAQLHEMRLAFMAGAQHLFASMIGMLDPEPEETPDDMRRMELIQHELDTFGKEIELWASKSAGNG